MPTGSQPFDEKVDGCQDGAHGCCCDCGSPSGTSKEPVRYWNGELELSASDFGAGGYGFPWGQTRLYNNRLIPGAVNHGVGVNWLVNQ